MLVNHALSFSQCSHGVLGYHQKRAHQINFYYVLTVGTEEIPAEMAWRANGSLFSVGEV